jgi:NADH dehydrogenase
MAGQIAELADHTLKGAYRHIDSTTARVILLDALPAVLAPMGEKLGKKAQARLEKMGVEIQLGAMVTDVDRNGITVKDSDGTIRRIESATKVWSAGVSASPLGRDLAAQSDVEIDRAGRAGTAGPVRTGSPGRVRRRRHGGGRGLREWRGRDPAASMPRASRPNSRAPTLRREPFHFDRGRWRRCRASPRSPKSARWFGDHPRLAWSCCTWSIWSDSVGRLLLSWTVTFLSTARESHHREQQAAPQDRRATGDCAADTRRAAS